MLDCLDARTKHYSAKQFIIREAESTEEVGVVLKGQIQIITEDCLVIGQLLLNLDRDNYLVK